MRFFLQNSENHEFPALAGELIEQMGQLETNGPTTNPIWSFFWCLKQPFEIERWVREDKNIL